MDSVQFREQLRQFVTESNRIENIHRPPTTDELDASHFFLDLDEVTIKELRHFVLTIAPGKRLRNLDGMNVQVGNHVPPPGGPQIERDLQEIVTLANIGDIHPYDLHVKYETLHPFMDGNGRSGRILWAWQMLNQNRWPGLKLGFLHAFYYQALERSQERNVG